MQLTKLISPKTHLFVFLNAHRFVLWIMHAEAFQQLGDLDLFDRVQLAAGNLLAVAERGGENVQSLTHILSVF